MQRAEKKKSSPETPLVKTKKTVSAEIIVKAEKPALIKKQTVAAVEKPVKKVKSKPDPKPAPQEKSATSAKIAVSAPPAKKSAAPEKVTPTRKIKQSKEIILKPIAATKTLPKTIKPEAANAAPQAKKTEAANQKTKPIEKKADTPNKKTVLKEKKAETVNKKTKAPEKKVEIVVEPIKPKPPVKKKLKPISSAVVRGKLGKYDFEVFPLDAELKDGSAIYVISKRITDKSGRGHHKFVCIGQTESLLGDLKKHKKDKCIKQHKANVICLLREESETNRRKIETDLRQAHTIVCNNQ